MTRTYTSFRTLPTGTPDTTKALVDRVVRAYFGLQVVYLRQQDGSTLAVTAGSIDERTYEQVVCMVTGILCGTGDLTQRI